MSRFQRSQTKWVQTGKKCKKFNLRHQALSDYYLHERNLWPRACRSIFCSNNASRDFLFSKSQSKQIFPENKNKESCWLSAEAIKLELSKFQQNNAQKFSLATLKNFVTLQRYECWECNELLSYIVKIPLKFITWCSKMAGLLLLYLTFIGSYARHKKHWDNSMSPFCLLKWNLNFPKLQWL